MTFHERAGNTQTLICSRTCLTMRSDQRDKKGQRRESRGARRVVDMSSLGECARLFCHRGRVGTQPRRRRGKEGLNEPGRPAGEQMSSGESPGGRGAGTRGSRDGQEAVRRWSRWPSRTLRRFAPNGCVACSRVCGCVDSARAIKEEPPASRQAGRELEERGTTAP